VPRLVFDIRANHDTGVSRYGLSVLAEAAPLLVADDWQVTVVARAWQDEAARRVTDSLDGRARVCTVPGDDGFVRRSAWLRDLAGRHDLYYTSHYTLDRACPVPFVFTIHDLHRLRSPRLSYTDDAFAERFGRDELQLVHDELATLAPRAEHHPDRGDNFPRYFAALTRHLAGRAERVVTVSRHTAQDIQQQLDVPSARIEVLPCGVDRQMFHPRAESEVAAVRGRYQLPGPYLLFVGLTHPNKRFAWLVEQLLAGRDRLPADARLVAVGGHAERLTDVRQRLAAADAADFVVYTGSIPDVDLAALYTGAAALVSASVSEGNGLPPQEALSCGCEAILTDIPAFRETTQDFAYRYPPHDGTRFAALSRAALEGRLNHRGSGFSPVTWAAPGAGLATALTSAMDDYRSRQALRIRA
jgi:glycosyltransferase involved in cell wall biosynthesis